MGDALSVQQVTMRSGMEAQREPEVRTWKATDSWRQKGRVSMTLSRVMVRSHPLEPHKCDLRHR